MYCIFFTQISRKFNVKDNNLGPVVQSMVSLTNSSRGQLVKCLTTLLSNTHIFFVEKMREAFAKASLFFSNKNIGLILLMFEILTKG